jgi:hypothetical protein
MVKVPEYQQTVDLRPEFRQDVEVRATPEVFGADVRHDERPKVSGVCLYRHDRGGNRIRHMPSIP